MYIFYGNYLDNFKKIGIVLSFILLISSVNNAVGNLSIVGVVPAYIGNMEFYETYKVSGEFKRENSKNYYAALAGTVDFIAEPQNGRVAAGSIILKIDENAAAAARGNKLCFYAGNFQARCSIIC